MYQVEMSHHSNYAVYFSDRAVSYSVYRELGHILDINDAWKDVAAALNYSPMDAARLERVHLCGGSPTENLLREWRQREPTVMEMCGTFLKCNKIQALKVLQRLLSPDLQNRLNQAIERKYDPPPNYTPTEGTDGVALMEAELPGPPQLPAPTHTLKQPTPSPSLSHPHSMYTLPSAEEHSTDTDKQHKTKLTVCVSEPKDTTEQDEWKPVMNSAIIPPAMDTPLELQAIRWSYTEIMACTSYLQHKIGSGSSGDVYYGRRSGVPVAVKKLYTSNEEQCKKFEKEICALNKYRGVNIIQLLGICIDGPNRCLVYPYMVNGSLEHRLAVKDKKKTLSWPTRHNILLGAARGIQYLHTAYSEPFIHGAVRSCNIMLDQHYEPHLTDLGESRMVTSRGVEGQYTSVTKDDYLSTSHMDAYLPHEYFTSSGKYFIKTDTYSFGVVILETCTGRRAFDGKTKLSLRMEEIYGTTPADILATRDTVCSKWPDQLYIALIELAENCTKYSKADRPKMPQVYNKLDELQSEVQTTLNRAATKKSSNRTKHKHASPPTAINDSVVSGFSADAANKYNSRQSTTDDTTISTMSSTMFTDVQGSNTNSNDLQVSNANSTNLQSSSTHMMRQPCVPVMPDLSCFDTFASSSFHTMRNVTGTKEIPVDYKHVSTNENSSKPESTNGNAGCKHVTNNAIDNERADRMIDGTRSKLSGLLSDGRHEKNYVLNGVGALTIDTDGQTSDNRGETALVEDMKKVTEDKYRNKQLPFDL